MSFSQLGEFNCPNFYLFCSGPTWSARGVFFLNSPSSPPVGNWDGARALVPEGGGVQQRQRPAGKAPVPCADSCSQQAEWALRGARLCSAQGPNSQVLCFPPFPQITPNSMGRNPSRPLELLPRMQSGKGGAGAPRSSGKETGEPPLTDRAGKRGGGRAELSALKAPLNGALKLNYRYFIKLPFLVYLGELTKPEGTKDYNSRTKIKFS